MKRAYHQHFYDQPRFWDAVIGVLLVFSASYSIWILHELSFRHHPLFTAVLWIMFLAMVTGFALTFYGSFIEPKRLVARKERISLPNAPHLRIVMASDFHVGAYKGKLFMEKVVARINATQPDIILLLGDFLDNEYSSTDDLAPLAELRAPHGVFAIVGNHDAGRYMDWRKQPYTTVDRTEEVRGVLESMNIVFLRNDHRIITMDHHSLAIAGSDDSLMDSCNLSETFKNIHSDTPIILLSHNPDVINNLLYERSNLIVSGHTHGGQIRLPFIGALGPMPTRIARHIDQGWFTLTDKTKLFITHGCGETWARARLFCPPEIVLMEINKP